MGGYRQQIKRACVKLDRRGKPFDAAAIHEEIPEGPYKPTVQQLEQMVRHLKYLKRVSDGDKHNSAKYRMRERFRGDRDGRQGHDQR